MRTDNIRWLRRPTTRNAVFRRRWKANWIAQLETLRGPMPCIVEDISAAGAKLRVGLSPIDGPASLLIVDFGPIAAHVAWRRGYRLGLHFDERQPRVRDLVVKAARANSWDPRGLTT